MRAEEATEVANMARRLTAIVLLRPSLDSNYRKIKESLFPWEQSNGSAGVMAAIEQ